ncbi:hypothetical protein [Dinghuibacter silviterrae]|uniref:AMP-activated protein kinase-like protein n=1 Tax=Dinghuibacter silviterrae TaxID=1539049 RepID=A0A4R8DGW4_9BACT|nr:hypothetical protein [Dinghuibacter silviterrae]TDW96484.1 AMP-activated protein kinase-like protein [Dinghuibacter silviterrae]
MEMRRTVIGLLIGVLLVLQGRAQEFTLMNGRMYITLPVHLSKMQLDSFVVRYDLGDMDLSRVLITRNYNGLKKKGWRVERDSRGVLQLSKQVAGPDDLGDVGKRMKITEEHPTFAELFPAENDNLLYGFNRFIHKYPFLVQDSMVTFFLRGHTGARGVLLAGSFTNWQNAALRMTLTDSGWIMNVKLGPGKYWYKFIIDGGWTIDVDNRLQEDDGQGNVNSVYYKPNFVFTLNRFRNAREVCLAGSFNNWASHELNMDKTASGWQVNIYLAAGTHTYKYVVDGTWYQDPENPAQLPDGAQGYNSVVTIGKPHRFFLKGYGTATSVVLAGSFNGWKPYELLMRKTSTGWALPYVLGPGNYSYRFIVDGKSIPDPENPYFVQNTAKGTDDSYVIISPNYTFRLHGFAGVTRVFLAGDFNAWTTGSLLMKRIGEDWIFSVHLSVGKHLYKFIADGEWMIDPGNPLWEDNEFGTGNSVIWMGH